MATTAATASVAAAFVTDAVDSECRPVEDLKVGFTGVMARYLASLEMAGCELEVPPEQFDAQRQRPCEATPSSRDCSEIGAQQLNGTSSPRRQQKVIISVAMLETDCVEREGKRKCAESTLSRDCIHPQRVAL